MNPTDRFSSRHAFARTLIAAALLSSSTLAAADPAADAKLQQMEQQVDSLAQQLQLMKAQLEQLKKQNEALAAQQEQQATAPAAAGSQTAVAKTSSPFDRLSLWGYGEIYYTHPQHKPDLTQADLARAVFGIGYRFDDKTRFNSEFEVEHAVSSSDDVGEFEVEQFYVEHQLTDWAAVEGGLFLMPFGLLNEHHEPTNFYGVQRNFTETLIIPSTWREGGIAFHGDSKFGLTWNVGLTTGMDLSKRDINPEFPQYQTALDLENNGVAPLQATHQELSLANAQHLSQYLALGYNGIPGVTAGASIFTGNAVIPKTPPGLPQQRVTLWEVHTRWTPGKADLSAVYARGTISDTAAFNLANAGANNLTPSKFYGYYVQGAYTVWHNSTYRLAPFVRWEHYDIGANFEGVAPGFSPVPTGDTPNGPFPVSSDRVMTYGANFWVTPHVVLKGDYQTFSNNSDFTRFDFGLGLDF